MTSGFFIFGTPIQPSLTVLPHTGARARKGSLIRSFSYQMAVTTQSIRDLLTRCGGAGLAVLAVGLLALPPAIARNAAPLTTGSVSGLPVPRFVSLKADRVNARSGPNTDQDVRWVYTRAGMPVEVIAEFENWRRIRDWQGADGWVYHSLLSGKRTAVVVPNLKDQLVPLYAKADQGSRVVAKLQGGVLGSLESCTGTWCEFRGKGFDGWVRQDRLWGAYPNEKID
jgi:SH3-like domain-containing protein